jgi:O-antigen/teichoic acid export membrane protein
MKTPLKSFSHIVLGRTASTLSQAVFYFIFAFLLDPESFGTITYWIAIAGVASIASRFGLNHSIVVYQAKNNISFTNNVNTFSIIFISIISLILLTVDIFIALLSFSSSLFLMSIQNMIGLKKYKKFLKLNILKGVLVVSLPILSYFYFDLSGILLGLSISYLISSIDFFKILKIKYFSLSFFRDNFKILFHNFGVDVSTTLVRFVDKLVIVPILGFSSLGIYQFNLQILIGMELIPMALHSFLLSEESSGAKHKKISIYVIIISIVCAFSIIVISPIFITEFLPKYVDGILSLQILILSLIPLSISAIFNAKLQSKESTKVGFSALIRIGTLVIFLIILGELYGLIGLSLAVLLSSIFYVIFLALIYNHDLKK